MRLKRIILSILLLYCAFYKSHAQEFFPYSASSFVADTCTLTLLIVGDLMQHQAQIDAAHVSGDVFDYSSCFSLIKEQITRADVAIGNLEVTLGGKPYSGYPAFSAPDEYLYAIKEAGFDVLLTANNHCLDRGKKGLERTIHLLDSLQLQHAGTYKNKEDRNRQYPLFIQKNGFRIALLNYTYGTNGLRETSPAIVNRIDTAVILKDICKAKSYNVDAIIACMHWGQEYRMLPDESQKKLASWLLQNGVTHIIGAHPHVIQPMELRTDGKSQHVVVYSLGNFISNMSASNTDGGLVFTMKLRKRNVVWPVWSDLVTSMWKEHSQQEDIPFVFPSCEVEWCGYSIVWTARPKFTSNGKFVLYPVDVSLDNLSKVGKQRLNLFKKNTSNFLKKHNIGIGELKK